MKNWIQPYEQLMNKSTVCDRCFRIKLLYNFAVYIQNRLINWVHARQKLYGKILLVMGDERIFVQRIQNQNVKYRRSASSVLRTNQKLIFYSTFTDLRPCTTYVTLFFRFRHPHPSSLTHSVTFELPSPT